MEKDAVSLFQSWKGQMVNVPLDIFRAIKLGPEGDDGWKGMTREFIYGERNIGGLDTFLR